MWFNLGFNNLFLLIDCWRWKLPIYKYVVENSRCIVQQFFNWIWDVFLVQMVCLLHSSQVLAYSFTMTFCRTRYFSTPRKGHNPLQGRAYYQLLECLGVWYLHPAKDLELLIPILSHVKWNPTDSHSWFSLLCRLLEFILLWEPRGSKTGLMYQVEKW